MYYVVIEGRKRGVYNSVAEIGSLGRGFSSECLKTFKTRQEADTYFQTIVKNDAGPSDGLTFNKPTLSLPGRSIVEIEAKVLDKERCRYNVKTTRADGINSAYGGLTEPGLSSTSMTILLLVDQHIKTNTEPVTFVIKDKNFLKMINDAPNWIDNVAETDFTLVIKDVLSSSVRRGIKYVESNPVSNTIVERTLPQDNIGQVFRKIMCT